MANSSNSSKIDSYLGDATGFISKVLAALNKDGISTSGLYLDHVCYRVDRHSRYYDMKNNLSSIAVLLSEEEINGRPIATYRLDNPIQHDNHSIYCIELPAPARNNKYSEGLEHAEFVIGKTFDQFIQCHPELKNKFDTSNANNPRNADIKLQYDGFAAKFHYQSLEEVIRQEKKRQTHPINQSFTSYIL